MEKVRRGSRFLRELVAYRPFPQVHGGLDKQSYEMGPVTSEDLQIVRSCNCGIAKRNKPDLGAKAAK